MLRKPSFVTIIVRVLILASVLLVAQPTWTNAAPVLPSSLTAALPCAFSQVTDLPLYIQRSPDRLAKTEEGRVRQAIEDVPESLMPPGERSQLRTRTEGAEALQRLMVPPAVTPTPPDKEAPSSPVEPAPVPVQPTPTSTSIIGQSALTLIPFVQEGNIWLIDGDDRDRRKITSSGHDFAPLLSPDGTQVAYLTAAEQGAPSPSRIQIIEIDGTNAISITARYGLVSLPAWSPDSQRLAFVQDAQLVIVDLRDMTRMILAANARFSGIGAPRPAWSPDGGSIVCVLEEDGLSTLWLINLDDGGREQLTTLKYQDTPYGFSPAGDIAYVQPSEEGDSDLYLITPGLGNRILTEDVIDFAWSPDGDALAVRRSDSSLWLVQTNGDNLREVSDEAEIRCWIDSNRLAYNAFDGIYRTDLVGVDNTKLVGFGEPQIRPLEVTAATLDTPWRTQFSGICGIPPNATNCGPASLGMSMALFGVNHSNDTIRRAINKHTRDDEENCGGSAHGTTWRELEWYARDKAGFERIGPSSGWSIDGISSQVAQGRPVLLLVHFKSLPGHEGSGNPYG